MKRGRGFNRTERVGDLIQQALARILLEEMGDERFRLVTITDVTVSRDTSYAKVYVSVLADDEETINQLVTALNRAAKSLRFSLAKAVDLRIIPELKFVYDATTAQGFHLSNLIDKAVAKSNTKKTK